MGRTVVPPVGDAVLSSERLFVGQQQALVRSVETALGERRLFCVYAHGFYEPQALVYLVSQLVVATACRRLLDEVKIPCMKSRDIGIAPHGEGAQDVECLRGLVIRVEHAIRVVGARFLREVLAVNDVPSVGRQGDSVYNFVCSVGGIGIEGLKKKWTSFDVSMQASASVGVGSEGGCGTWLRSGLGELPCYSPHLDHGQRGSVGEHERHLQDDPEGIPVSARQARRAGSVSSSCGYVCNGKRKRR